MTDFQIFEAAYITALEFTDCEELSGHDLGETTLRAIRGDTMQFFICNHGLMAGEFEQAGHDFWLSRNGHGAGFWDGDWCDTYADMLTKGSMGYGPFETYLGDDGLIHA